MVTEAVQVDRRAAGVVEEPDAVVEEGRGHVDVDLVDQPALTATASSTDARDWVAR